MIWPRQSGAHHLPRCGCFVPESHPYSGVASQVVVNDFLSSISPQNSPVKAEPRAAESQVPCSHDPKCASVWCVRPSLRRTLQSKRRTRTQPQSSVVLTAFPLVLPTGLQGCHSVHLASHRHTCPHAAARLTRRSVQVEQAREKKRNPRVYTFSDDWLDPALLRALRSNEVLRDQPIVH